jgi:hypothetical protein
VTSLEALQELLVGVRLDAHVDPHSGEKIQALLCAIVELQKTVDLSPGSVGAAEQLALEGNLSAVTRVVQCLRKYREVLRWLRDQRYADGENDAVAISTADDRFEEADKALAGLEE